MSTVVYNSTCSVITDNTQLQCSISAGAAANLIWSVVIAGQVSAQPTTSYEPPVVTAVTDQFGNVVANADVNGGTILYLTGTGFGPVDYNGLTSAGNNVSLVQVRMRVMGRVFCYRQAAYFHPHRPFSLGPRALR